MSLKNLCIAICALMMTACASYVPQSPDLKCQQANLCEPCPDLAEPVSGSGADVLRWAIYVAGEYRTCQAKHRRLAEK